LHQKFKKQYANSEASYMAHLRDLPPIAGAIIWATQIERQLAAEMKRVEDILGKGWEVDVQGQKLKADGDRFRRKLNTSLIFDEWVKDVESRNFQVFLSLPVSVICAMALMVVALFTLSPRSLVVYWMCPRRAPSSILTCTLTLKLSPSSRRSATCRHSTSECRFRLYYWHPAPSRSILSRYLSRNLFEPMSRYAHNAVSLHRE